MRKPKEKYALDPEAEASIEQIAEGLRRYLRILLIKEDPPRMRIPTKPATHSDMKAATHSEAKAATLPELAASRAHGGSKWPP